MNNQGERKFPKILRRSIEHKLSKFEHDSNIWRNSITKRGWARGWGGGTRLE